MTDHAALPPIQVHLCVKGGAEAIAFYEKVFAGHCTFRQLADDGVRILHANIDMFGSQIMLHDEFPEMGGDVLAPHSRGGASLSISINLPAPDRVDAVVAKAESAGATVTMPPTDMFWGARYARIRDPFGHVWAFNAPTEVA